MQLSALLSLTRKGNKGYSVPMIKEIHMRVLPQVAYDNKALYDNLAKLAKVDKNSINGIQIKRQSIDARRYPVMVDMSVLTFSLK